MCKIDKPLSNFFYHYSYCTPCWKQRSKKYRISHPEIFKKSADKCQKLNIDAWKTIIPSKANCEVCGKEVFLITKDRDTSIHFDHRHGRNDSIKEPSHWLRRNPLNKKNLAIWEACDFGMLCRKCNSYLPTDNRGEWFKNASRYINRTSKVLHASEGARGVIAT
jgi:hypothetical protein